MHADHFIWSAYGTWLPSCPRESWPRYIRSWERTRLDLQPDNSVVQDSSAAVDERGKNDPYHVNRMLAEKTRRFPPVRFSLMQMHAIAEGFERCARSRQAYLWACCIMPEYVQLLVTCPRTPASQLMGMMRGEATKRLCELDLHPLQCFSGNDGQTPLMWSHTKWHQQLKDDASVQAAIEYMNRLPAREGKPEQEWSFVREFQGLDKCREESEVFECGV